MTEITTSDQQEVKPKPYKSKKGHLLIIGIIGVLLGLVLWMVVKLPGYKAANRPIQEVTAADRQAVMNILKATFFSPSTIQRCGKNLYYVEPQHVLDVSGGYYDASGHELTQTGNFEKTTWQKNFRGWWYDLQSCTADLTPLIK